MSVATAMMIVEDAGTFLILLVCCGSATMKRVGEEQKKVRNEDFDRVDFLKVWKP